MRCCINVFIWNNRPIPYYLTIAVSEQFSFCGDSWHNGVSVYSPSAEVVSYLINNPQIAGTYSTSKIIPNSIFTSTFFFHRHFIYLTSHLLTKHLMVYLTSTYLTSTYFTLSTFFLRINIYYPSFVLIFIILRINIYYSSS